MRGLGCMRLSTEADRDDAGGLAVLRAALAGGIELLDTAGRVRASTIAMSATTSG